jgi:two-component system, sensor histidine kinase RegB
MSHSDGFPEFLPERGDWLRLQTLILLRWLAIGGQSVALVVATRVYDIRLPLSFCYLAIGAAVIANLISVTIYPPNKRLTEQEALLTLLFDLSQLSFLLFLTGGLSNPFALLILAPVTVSASTLPLRATVIVGGLAVGFVTLVAAFSVPMRLTDGTVLRVPTLLEFGFWLSLVIGIVFLGLYSHRVATEMHSMQDALLATQMALAREQKLTDLGGVVAAAAHELGTPLATIKMVSTEMIDELDGKDDLQDDARLIRDQADRCRDILRSMGKAGKDDLHMRQAPLAAVLREAAEPHLARGKTVIFTLAAASEADQQEPLILRRPELIHGLRNLTQNAVDFAKSKVWVDAHWTTQNLTIRIIDDGSGFPAQLLGRIGDPFLRPRTERDAAQARPGYEGMGLGLFIAKTLLERTGAELSFANAADPFLTEEERPERCGAIIEVIWPLEAISSTRAAGIGENRPIG